MRKWIAGAMRDLHRRKALELMRRVEQMTGTAEDTRRRAEIIRWHERKAALWQARYERWGR